MAEQASGLNENRRGITKLLRLAQRAKIDVVLVEYRDRLARFRFFFLARTFQMAGVRVEVLEGQEEKDPPKNWWRTCFRL